MDHIFKKSGKMRFASKCAALIILVAGIIVGVSNCPFHAGVESIAETTETTEVAETTEAAETVTVQPSAIPSVSDELPINTPNETAGTNTPETEDGMEIDEQPPEEPELPVESPAEQLYIDRWVSIYAEIGDENAIGDLAPQNVEIIEREDNWIKTSTELGENWVDTDSIRQAVLLDVPSYDQRELGYPLGCELVAIAMMMNYETEVSVHVLAEELPRADHPDEGFRGDPASSTRGWTIFPPALSGMMEKHLGSSYDMSGMEMDDLKEQLNANTPVMVWIRGLGWPVHALCLSGYDKDGFYYNDPWTGEKDAFISYNVFYEIWNDPIIDRVLDLIYSPRKALSYYAPDTVA